MNAISILEIYRIYEDIKSFILVNLKIIIWNIFIESASKFQKEEISGYRLYISIF